MERDPDIPQYGVLTRMANKHGSDKGTTFHGFTDFYESYLGPMRNEIRKVLEIGVWKGASLRMWRDFFPGALIFGMDRDLAPYQSEDTDRIMVFAGDQTNRTEMAYIEGPLDLIVDDGGHSMDQQQISLAALFPKLRPGGLYILEDLHTSLMYPGWGIDDDHGNTTLQMMRDFQVSGAMTSRHMTSDEMEYLTEQIAEVRVFRGKSPLSLTSILRKRA